MFTCYEQCGWKDGSFLIGTSLISAEGVTEIIGTDEVNLRGRHLVPTPNGSAREWVSVVNKLTADNRHAITFTVLASFAAPLLYLAGVETGGIISNHSVSSGTGKTMALKIAASVWGQWDGTAVANIDTHASKGLTMAALGHLPVVFDEMALLFRDNQPELLRDFVMMFSGGRDKMRAKQHGLGIQHTQNHWLTLLLTASNVSIVDLLEATSNRRDGEAPAYRVMEFKVDYPRHLDYAYGDELAAQLFANAGWAGRAYIEHLLQPETMAWTQRALKAWTHEIWKATGWGAQCRFWVRTLGAISVAGELVRQLGLLSCDPPEVVRWAMNQLGHRDVNPTQQRTQSEHVIDCIAVLGEFLNKHSRDTLVVKKSWKPGEMRTPAERIPTGQLLVRYESETGRLSIPVRAWRQYLVDHGHTFTDVMRGFEESTVLTTAKRMVTLGAGTSLVGAPVSCVEFDMQHPLVSHVARDIRKAS